MKIGEKIAYLRNKAGMSQDALAESLGISRQSVSKWEKGNSLPQFDKLAEICDLFAVSADQLIRDEISLCQDGETTDKMYSGRYFGTDGFRGEANVELTSSHAYKVGRFLGWYYSTRNTNARKTNERPKILIGKDTRRSSYMLEYSIVAGITASGADAYMLHVTTTPSVSYVTRQDEFDCGIMITASHNPYYDNGIKIVNKYGEKLDDKVVSMIESYLDGDLSALNITGKDLPVATRDNIGLIVDYVAGRNRYVGYLISLASHSYKNLKIGLDCANGAAWSIAKAVFDALGAQTYVIGASPDGLNINEASGSTHIENLTKFVKDNHLDVGFAFDGDADRCIAVDENGDVVDGDKIMYILANRLKSRGNLHKDTVALTVMSNMGLLKAFDNCGISYEITSVGDRFVYQKMQGNGYGLGGEQSGHIIIRKYATTGDAILTAIMLTEEMKDNKTGISKLCEKVKLFPQITESVPVIDKDMVMEDPLVLSSLREVEERLEDGGRVLLRASGTEPVVRIMVEAPSNEICATCIETIKNAISTRGLNAND
jgi:phosphoglucosamine mutase